ncbi:hypothetical protein [Wenzhouxiangella marina]|uniref:Uncharacterized protein n=1 Tax=Wenzhouxiangella marina TaxID=1579979 RepID=A0A0K0XUN2_9GAMM|nr:hypothetical protein [Wenzhouxiangella marina]AKS41375.1 hypothetical protein WM2015_998 [Wenzhouxiangella marina]MBB6086871.1 hypothetical protein [Wenzhouxiangella marina]
MTRSLIQSALLLAATSLLLACGGSPGPDADELEAELVARVLPASWQIESLSISAAENTGSEVEPIITTRFELELELQQDLYEPAFSSQPLESEGGRTARHIAGRRVIEKVRSEGDEEIVFGLARSVRRGEGWQTLFELESMPWRYAGEPLSGFGNDYVIAGSEQETELIAEVEEAWRAEQERLAEAERREQEALAATNQAILELLGSGFAELEAERNGDFVNAIAEFQPPGQIERRFDLPIVFAGATYTYHAIIRDGRLRLTDPEGNCRVELQLLASGEQLEGVSTCSLMPGAIAWVPTSEAALSAKYQEANQQLLAFFQSARSNGTLSFTERNLTFGGSNTFTIEITGIEGTTINLDGYRYGRKQWSAVWYIQYGKIRSRTTDAFWYFLEYRSPEALEGRRYNNRPNRPIGLELRRG